MNVFNKTYKVLGQLHKKCSIPRVTIFILFIVPLYNESLTYIFHSWLWPSLHIKDSSGEVLRILFVADPQLQGYNDESPTFGFLTRWDADRYLHKTFTLAFGFVQPDVVIYLGDLLDEGSTASDSEYEDYFSRFRTIFEVNEQIVQIYVPGDNDVGGEGFDPVQEWKVNRFMQHFSSGAPEVQYVKFMDFLKMHYNYGRTYDEQTRKQVTDMTSRYHGKFHAILNHMTFMDRVRQEFEPLVEDTKASIIFSAHSHVARLYTCIDCHEKQRSFKWNGGIKDMKDYSVYTLRLNSDVTLSEITVPTCSYRMGVPQMGYGYAQIGISGEMHYTVLWLPSRYRQLFSYIYVLVALPLLLLSRQLVLRWHSYRKLNGYASR